ncbi:MAG: MotA/TolQ/ExbB proton channel family protein [Deltaproteobacteria bacterium]|nr:MotA/TolQ/ExbB proton channel family protein [Candidatus Anaeroferrophillus wilburensis]MBN2889836.1 MotA/TolQ/ExbB proton channel family protein [Deltaproteobacteria bacterium]
MKNVFIIVMLSFFLAGSAAAASFEEAQQQLAAEYRQAVEEQHLQRRSIAAAKKELKDQLVSQRETVARLEQGNAQLEARLDDLLHHEQELETKQQTVLAEMNELAGTVRTGARDLTALLETSLVSGTQPGRAAVPAALLADKRFPTMAEVKAITAIYFDEIQAGGRIEKTHGRFIGLDGRFTAGDIVRFGALTAIYQQDDDQQVGFAVYGKENDVLLAISKAPWAVKRCLKKYLAGTGHEVYLDFSGGTTVRQLALQPTAWERLQSGGMLIWPILLIGVIAFAISLERFFFLRRVKSNTDTVMVEVTGLIAAGQGQESLELLENRHGPVYNVLAAGLTFRHATRDVLENVLEEAIMKELPRLEKFLPTLQVLAAIAPLLGLLGTVTGMIDTFQVITIFGTGDPKMMSGGISEALVTTKLGLMVAIPIILLHTFFTRKVETVIGDMEEKAVGLTVALVNKKRQSI